MKQQLFSHQWLIIASGITFASLLKTEPILYLTETRAILISGWQVGLLSAGVLLMYWLLSRLSFFKTAQNSVLARICLIGNSVLVTGTFFLFTFSFYDHTASSSNNAAEIQSTLLNLFFMVWIMFQAVWFLLFMRSRETH